MDPITALALACNIVDLVGVAIKCGTTVVQAYNSVDGRHKAHQAVESETDRLKGVVITLQANQSKLAVLTAEEEIQQTASRIATQCMKLHTILDNCRAKKSSILSASKATLKYIINSGKIEELQRGLESYRRDLNSLIAIGTRYVTPLVAMQ
jgi:hypothetical protein